MKKPKTTDVPPSVPSVSPPAVPEETPPVPLALPECVLACPGSLALLYRIQVLGDLPADYYNAWESLPDPNAYAPTEEVEDWLRHHWDEVMPRVPVETPQVAGGVTDGMYANLAEKVNAGASSEAASVKPSLAFQVLSRLKAGGAEVTPELARTIAAKVETARALPRDQVQPALRQIVAEHTPERPPIDVQGDELDLTPSPKAKTSVTPESRVPKAAPFNADSTGNTLAVGDRVRLVSESGNVTDTTVHAFNERNGMARVRGDDGFVTNVSRPSIDERGNRLLKLGPDGSPAKATSPAPASPAPAPTALHPADELRLRGLERERADLAAELDLPTTTAPERQARQERIAEIDTERARLASPTVPAAPAPAPAASPAPGPVAAEGTGTPTGKEVVSPAEPTAPVATPDAPAPAPPSNAARSEMPQVAAEHRGALANFLQARSIGWENADVRSPRKVMKTLALAR